MKPKIMLFAAMGLGVAMVIRGATYQRALLDGRHFQAIIGVQGETDSYTVDVVFVKRAANIAFPDSIPPLLKSKLLSGRYLTLYLLGEEIENPDLVALRQVKPPLILDNRDPADWETDVIWEMKVKLK